MKGNELFGLLDNDKQVRMIDTDKNVLSEYVKSLSGWTVAKIS
jgi:hypothetical protein